MISALKRPLTYILTGIITLIGVGTPFLVSVIVKSMGKPPFPYYYLLLIITGVYAFFAYLFGDIALVQYKRKNPSFNEDISPEANLKIWTLRWPFIFGLLACLIVFIILYIIYAVTHAWPLM